MTNPQPRTVLIVGAGRGIGRAVALDLAEHTDWRLLLASKSESVRDAADACNAARNGCAEAFPWDVADPAPHGLAVALHRAAGPLALVYAAGALGPRWRGSAEDWRRTFAVNLHGAVNAMSLLADRMLTDRAGRVVVFSGGGSCGPRSGYAAYAASKTALLRTVELVADDMRSSGVWVTALAPGCVDTDMSREAGETPNTDISEPVRLVRRLLTEDCGHLSGRLVHVRDEWPKADEVTEHLWKLRRVLS